MTGKCFVIMPFTVRDIDLSRYYGDQDHWSEVYRGLILPAVEKAGMTCERDDEELSSRLITEGIWRKLEEADVVLCDLSAGNTNVFLELGWTLRADKRFILVKDDLTDFSFDLHQFFTYQYSHRLQPSSVRRSVEELAGVIQSTVSDSSRQYSVVRKVSLDVQAVREAAEGNIEVSLLRELLNEVRSTGSREQLRGAALQSPQFSFGHIQTQEQLAGMLLGSTWRKLNNVEHLIFEEPPKFFNNHAGHPTWRENKYRLGASLGSMTLEWSIDGFETECEFSYDYTEFAERSNPIKGIWTLIAVEPYTPHIGF